MSKREAILAQVATILAATSGVAGRIYRSRTEPLERGEAPAIVIEPVNDNPVQDTLATLSWTLTFSIAIITRGLVPDQLADPILTDAHSRLMVDTTLAGLAFDVSPVSVSFEALSADQSAGVLVALYACKYRTSLTSLT